jgi:hypothetical protein
MSKKRNGAGSTSEGVPERLYPTEREEKKLRELKERFRIPESFVVQGTPDRESDDDKLKSMK